MNKKIGSIIKQIWFWICRYTNPAFLKLVYRRLRPNEKKLFWGASAVFMLSLAALAASAYYEATILISVSGGTYREGIIGQPTVVNPVLNQSNDADRDLGELLFSAVLKSNGRGGTKPDLAERVEISDNGQVWTIYLKNNVYWHDGEKFTADDIIFTIDAIQNPDTGSPLYASWQGVVAERVSTYEIKLYLRNSYPAFEENLKELKVIPKHIFESIPHANFRFSPYNRKPVGTGPFKFKALQERKDGFITNYTLSKHDRYHLGNLFLEQVDISFFENEKDLAAAFNKREIDGFGMSGPQTFSLLNTPYRILRLTLPRYYAIFLNQTIAPQLGNSAVREALKLATDKQSLVKSVFEDRARIANGPVLKGMIGYDETLDAYEYNIGRAIEILETAGWMVPEEGGRIRTKNDAHLKFDLVVPETQQLVQTAEFLKAGWEKIGVKLNIVRVPISEIAETYIKDRVYQMLIFGNVVNFNSDLFSFWHSSQKFHPGLNLSLFNNKKVDELIESSRKSLQTDERVKNLSEIQRIMNEKIPAIFLFSPDYLYVTNNKLHGARETMVLTPAERFSQVENWAVKKARVFK